VYWQARLPSYVCWQLYVLTYIQYVLVISLIIAKTVWVFRGQRVIVDGVRTWQQVMVHQGDVPQMIQWDKAIVLGLRPV